MKKSILTKFILIFLLIIVPHAQIKPLALQPVIKKSFYFVKKNYGKIASTMIGAYVAYKIFDHYDNADFRAYKENFEDGFGWSSKLLCEYFEDHSINWGDIINSRKERVDATYEKLKKYDISKFSPRTVAKIVRFVGERGRELYNKSQNLENHGIFSTQLFSYFSDEMKRLAEQGGLNLIEYLPRGKPKKSFAQSMIDKYNQMSEEELKKMRKYWDSDKFLSELRYDACCYQVVKKGKEIKKSGRDHNVIISLGQSMAYWVLAAELIDRLSGKDIKRKYCYLPFSGDFNTKKHKDILEYYNKHGEICFKNNQKSLEGNKKCSFDCDDLYKKAYAHYLKSYGIDEKDNKLICEQVEFGFGLKSFLSLLSWKKYDIFINDFYKKDLYAILFPSLKDKVIKITKEDGYVFVELNGTRDQSFRLVPSYPQKTWLFANPFDFSPGPEAEDRALRLIDYIKHQWFRDQLIHN